jgi:hypothetical protein|tara:strand:- start:1331 stop:1729 length:399 start_codon:yes stop_codon:yes gene_type:complete
MSPFEFINQINHGKTNLIDQTPEVEKEYKSFIVNRGLSFNHDTALYANEMNFHSHLDSKLQFDFFLNTIRPKKRYGKWLKRKKEDNVVLELIKKYCKCSYAKARDYALLLNESQLDIIRQQIDIGGLKGNNE